MSSIHHHYYASGHTAEGYYRLTDSVLKEISNCYVLTGGPGTGKSTFIQSVAEELKNSDHHLEYLHAPSEPGSLDGLIIRNHNVALVDEQLIKDTDIEHMKEKHFIHLSEGLDPERLSENKKTIIALTKQIQQLTEQAYQTFHASLRAHDDLEDIYISSMNFNEANLLTNELIELFYGKEDVFKAPKIEHRFLGAATPEGAKDFIQQLTQNVQKRYFIKGRAGSGKSTMLKKIATAGEQKGYDVEIYHCGFDPNSLDMIILRELGIAIFDSTAPHEYFPDRETDEIIDVYKRCITEGTDETFTDEIAEATKRYKDKMTEAISTLKDAKHARDELKAIYSKAMDYSLVNQTKDKWLSDFLQS
ncbi:MULTISPECIES: PRK06851 family protein [Pontibacillus]|uniref:PRK06851 family protein n=1 Tax=Pontibacillus chungwhensis TaxID=265426 RepID=A0ABY8USG4_9BACI|nr:MULTISPECIES: PRK06851 family protein [Pontibacillus]MCD5322862.1 PRK06851 family protein [Pontibacillus sp. HN14]WIF96260.1 PRK06851 family protein [Pontibacillus chungwhensis]